MSTENIKTFVSATTLARKLNMAQRTLSDRLRSRGVMPDGILLHGNQASGLLFDSERLPELRRALSTQPEIQP